MHGLTCAFCLNLLLSEWPKLYGVLAILSAIGLNSVDVNENKTLTRNGHRGQLHL